ncbi:MAG: hypothetical protein PHY59_00705 [Methanobacterium sp.]|nr:hypothetical protein [Methanobacterium sp.]
MTVKDKTEDSLSISLYDDREIILSKLNEAIGFLHEKSISGRVNNEKKETVRINWFKTMGYICSVYNQIKRDVELEDLKKEIDNLKEMIENDFERK